jgi:glycosyltransferase involved in cell wall biosynthesis
MSVPETNIAPSTPSPYISVILPAYNCAPYLTEAIQSILQQTFANFELIIINDGSTDNTEAIIRSFTDNRIVYVKNEQNKGLIYTLNKGIELAKGKYIARMDGDDVCLPERLSRQKIFLDENQNIAAVATTITYINDQGNIIGAWDLDQQTTSPQQIRKKLAYENCIAHPTIMIRADIAASFRYKDYQKNIEDYDLWLRLYNHKHSIAKLKDPQLHYRIHDSSITGVYLKNKNFFFTHFAMKRKFLYNEVKTGIINGFTFIVFLGALLDAVKGFLKSLKKFFNH